jgi:purine-binding chemotaxis protein CheW
MPKPPQNRAPIDWAAARARLAAMAATREAGREGAAAEQALLERRARALAVRPPASQAAEATFDVVAFELGGQEFGIEATFVREAVLPRDLTPLPRVPAFVRGLVNLRSRVVPAFDLRPLLRLRAPAEGTVEKLLVVVCEGVELGLLIERVNGLRAVPAARLGAEVPGLDARHLRGLAPDGLIVLALPALLPDLTVDEGPDA